MEALKFLEKDLYLACYSRATRESYLNVNQNFLEFIKKSPREVSQRDIETFLLHKFERGISSRTVHQAVAALKYYYCTVLKRKFSLKYPKLPKNFPTVLSRAQIKRMIKVTENPKHRLLIQLLYGSGLRVSEAIKVRREDLDFGRGLLKIREGKGRKDRIVILSNSFVKACKGYLSIRLGISPYIFPAQQGHITIRTAQLIIKNAAKRAIIQNRVFCHALRSSFATHMIENGTSIHHIQKLLGHSHIKTTLGYIKTRTDDIIHLKSPLP